MPKNQRSLAILMLLWSGYYMAFCYIIVSIVGWQQVINNIEMANPIIFPVAFLLILSAVYILFSILVATYKASLSYQQFIKYGPVFTAALVTTVVIISFGLSPIKKVSEIGLESAATSIIFLLMPWYLAISSYHFVERNSSSAT